SLSRLLAFEPGFTVAATAHNARLGRTEVARQHPDVVVIDVNLPDQDGISLARELHAERPELGVVLISVEESAQLRRRAPQGAANPATAAAASAAPRQG